MRTPLHRRTEEIGACIADPFANGEGREFDTFTIPHGRRRQVYRPDQYFGAALCSVNPMFVIPCAVQRAALLRRHGMTNIVRLMRLLVATRVTQAFDGASIFLCWTASALVA